ncbi:molybdopterin-containing oxidoreductase family protein [Novosphingobium album (ex Liu et al. 2023)]|uniref:Molybdopterin-dependent oxidoreductase n=1 Tax=Novosphingobium album (ex Liu et al. 2023) TaxID=3031130 RepID=A0ABT5WT34_9SPHN|nr:molybdopterin-dependent oxidoreductase [Novosphingobium album (ex Liu et al. 2023)]MDE8652976.1 molybdopterin-dependent oxidoreductase [Novosphingobium album (ex Liu et al. 2023)]
MGQPVETKRGYCKVCTAQCGVVIDVAGDRIVQVKGDRAHPLTRGYTCPKGRAVGQWHHHADAITAPMMRKHGELVPVSWDEALDDLAAKLAGIVARHGPHAVGMFFGSGLGVDSSGYRMAEALHAAWNHPPRFSPITIDGTAKIMVASLMGGFPGFATKIDFDNADMVLFVGSNPMVSHGHNNGMFNPAPRLKAMAARGEVWTIDPLFTETAKFSTRHIAPYPATDHVILAWLAREIIDNGLVHPAQPITGLAELRAALEDFDRARAAAIAGVAESDLADLFAAVRARGRVVVETGTGVTMSETANVSHWLAWAIMILTGAMNRPGGVWFHPGFLTRFDAIEMPPMHDPFTPGPPTMPGVDGLIGEWPCAALPGEIAAGNIRAVVNLGGSLIRSFPDANALAPALRELEVLVSFEIIANETTALSTHVLPTKDQIERPEMTLWDTLGSQVCMQYSPAMVPPMGERRSAWWVLAQLMRRMGMAVPDHVPDDDRAPGADHHMLARMMTPEARCTFEELVATGYVERAHEIGGAWFDRHIARMGGWRLAPPRLLEFWRGLRAAERAAPGARPRLRFISRRQRRKLNGSLEFLGSPADIILNPADAAAYGIAHGQQVRVFSDRGEISLTANVDPAIRQGVASIPHGHGKANVNYLTDTTEVDPLGGQVLYTGIPIELEAIA